MWDRFRSATGGGATATAASSSAGEQSDPFPARMLASSGAKGRAATFSPSSSSTPSNHNWQPRTAAVDAQQQHHHQYQQQQYQGQVPPQRQQTFEYGFGRLAGKAAGPPPRPNGEYESTNAPSGDYPYQQHSQQQRQQRFQTLPVRPPPQHQNQHARRNSHGRPTSSIYSQPSPLHTDFARSQPVVRYPYATDAGEVSPPSSPEVSGTPLAPYQDISPIDEEDDWPAATQSRQHAPPHSAASIPGSNAPADQSMLPSQRRIASREAELPSEQVEEPLHKTDTGRPKSPAASTTRSNIPMMRRERRQKKEAQAAAGRQKTTPASPSGEGHLVQGLGISTVSAASPPSSPEHIPPPRNESRTTRAPAGPRGPKQQQPISQTDPAAAAFVASRPGWKGASGRTAIVDPVRDNLEAEPLKIPPKSAKRASPRSTESGQQQQQSGMQNDGAGAGNVVGSGIVNMMNGAIASPPISPETQKPKQQALGQIGGGGSVGELAAPTAPSAASGGGNLPPSNSNSTATTKSSFASTFRKIIPSSGQRQSRIFSGTAISSLGRQSPANQPQHQRPSSPGYPSPPLSGTTPLETPQQYPAAPVADANAGTVHAPHGGHQQPSQTLNSPSQTNQLNQISQVQNQNLFYNRPGSLRRKQVGTTTVTSNSTNHRPHDSVSSSVYSAPDEIALNNALALDNNNHNLLETNSAVHTAQQPLAPSPPLHQQPVSKAALDTKNLPSLPGEASADSPYIQPPSRFSITTYATSARDSSPRDSIDTSAPPLPTPPKDFVMSFAHSNSVRSTQGGSGLAAVNGNHYGSGSETAGNGESVLDRKRPDLRGGENRWEDPESDDAEPVKISLSKAWMSTAGANSAGINAMNSPPRSRRPTPRALNFLFDRGNNKKSNNTTTTTTTTTTTATTVTPSPPQSSSLADPPRATTAPLLSATSTSSKEHISTPINANANKTLGFGFLSQLSPATTPTSRPASIISNVDKDLPPAPSVTAAAAAAAIASTSSSSTAPGGGTTSDRIAQLTAQLEDLANRRLNINRAIKQMTELMPKDNLIMPDEVRKKRDAEKRKIEELRSKLSDIQGEEHDLGMKLHRAYKKLDKQTEYEPTTLWVRRATGA